MSRTPHSSKSSAAPSAPSALSAHWQTLAPREQHLVRAAARLFRKQGFDGTSTRDIATAADMQSGSPFYYFDSKSAILAAVMQSGMADATARQAKALQALLDVVDGSKLPLAGSRKE